MTAALSASHPALSRGAGLSAWRQIADDIEAAIAGGELSPGGRLPSEAQFAARYGVNRHTVRRALAALSVRGLVRTDQGRGTFVEAPPIAYPIGARTRFSEIVARAGREAWGDLIRSGEIRADEATAAALRVPSGADILELVTVHRADDTPISTARTLLPLPRFAGLDGLYAKSGSLTRAYKARGVGDYTRVSTRITARIAGAEEARLLDLAPGRVVLVVDSINADGEGRPFQATRACFAADRVEFVVET